METFKKEELFKYLYTQNGDICLCEISNISAANIRIEGQLKIVMV